MKDLNFALDEEMKIWSMVYESQENQHAKAFCCPDTPGFPQWNVVYPKKIGNTIEIDPTEFQDFFEKHNCNLHQYVSHNPNSNPMSVDEYFIFQETDQLESTSIDIREETDLQAFSKTVIEANEMAADQVENFAQKMQEIKDKTPALFLHAFIDGKAVGSVSAFQSSEGVWFGMNGAVIHKYRRQGIMKQLLTELVKRCDGNMLTHSNSESLRKKVLPALGFKSLGILDLIKPERVN